MASGYEKAACGVDPNEGWDRPSRLENAAQWFVAILGSFVWLFIVYKVVSLLFG